MTYCDHSRTVHMDEKWFQIFKVNQKVWAFPEEDLPERFCANKHHLTKVMFLIAVTRPIYDAEGNCIFDGKIGIWPFAEESIAIRNSVNRPEGTIEWKGYSVNREAIREMLFVNVLP